ncbi:MAG: hypothetical protein EOO43_00875 [Flavobacterium sp.]|nr:MAG: hypothetical protein EOO43_00875 [Flavobacterium sp.]
MCSISENLKLCTCSDILDVEELENYWILYRHRRGRDVRIMGLVTTPIKYLLAEGVENRTKVSLAQILNDNNCFDFPYKPKAQDMLAIFLHPEKFKIQEKIQDYERLDYGFEYQGGRWNICDYDTFEWQWKHTEYKSGKAINVFSE